ncbi:MAG: porin [Tepidisphaerales bacterium]
MNRSSWVLRAAALVAVAGLPVYADTSELQQQVDELKGQVAELEARQSAGSREMAATVESVLRDAERRSTMLAAGDSGAGYDNGFYIRSGGFYLRPGFLFQFWNVTDYRNNTNSGGAGKNDQTENGFEIHRAQLLLEGTAFDKALLYRFMWKTDTNTGNLILNDAYTTCFFADQWAVLAGQFKHPVNHEAVVTNGNLLATERSLLDAYLGGGAYNRVQGAGLVYGGGQENNPINAVLALHDGPNSLNTDYVGHYPNDPSPTAFGPHSYDFGVGGRFDYKAAGKWADYNDFTARNVKDTLFVLGVDGDWSQGGDGNLLTFNADAQAKFTDGVSLYGGVTLAHFDAAATGGDAVTRWGFILQGAYAFNPAWEVFARYSYLDFGAAFTSSNGDSEDKFHEITVGVNYYLGENGSAGRRAKITVDVNYLPNGTPTSFTKYGYLGDSNFGTELVVRGQFQFSL